MKNMGVVMWAIGGSLFIVSAYAACPPEAWMCASPMSRTNPNDPTRRLAEEPTLFEHGHFALQRDDSDPSHAQLRPVFKVGSDMRVSVKASPHGGEVKVKWRF